MHTINELPIRFYIYGNNQFAFQKKFYNDSDFLNIKKKLLANICLVFG